jgi:hypothetical protein
LAALTGEAGGLGAGAATAAADLTLNFNALYFSGLALILAIASRAVAFLLSPGP